MRRIISENGMSLKLVQHCNESNIFLKEFIKLFDNFKADNIDYIQFTGDNGVGDSNLKPDITIRYNNGEKAYIEVKTNANTCYQKSQTENNEDKTERKSYIKLLQDENKAIVGDKAVESEDFIQSHLGYLLDKAHYDQMNSSLNLPKVSWNEVYEKVLQFGYRDFARDIKENVDGIINDEEEIVFTPYDIALLYNSRLFNEKLEILQDLEKTKYETVIDEIDVNLQVPKDIYKIEIKNNGEVSEENQIKINDYLVDKSKPITLNKDEFKVETYYDSISYNICLSSDYSIYYGWEPEILENKIIYKTKGTKIEDYLYSFAIDKELLNINKLQKDNVHYLEDENRWIYFPATPNFSLNKNNEKDKTNNTTPCTACRESNDIEQARLDKLNICKTIICFNKMQKLFEKSESIIVDKLNKVCKKGYEFVNGKGFDNNSYFYIDVKDKEENVYDELICYGIMQNAFYKDFTEEKNIIPADYFLSVCFNTNKIKNNLDIEALKKEYGVLDKNGWLYYPICRMTLCKENYLEAFSDKVVSIIKDVLSL